MLTRYISNCEVYKLPVMQHSCIEIFKKSKEIVLGLLQYLASPWQLINGHLSELPLFVPLPKHVWEVGRERLNGLEFCLLLSVTLSICHRGIHHHRLKIKIYMYYITGRW